MATYCEKCGAEVQPGYKFCERCGAPVPVAPAPFPAPVRPQHTPAHAAPRQQVCATCGAPLQPGYKFCEVCGSPVASAPAADPVPPVSASALQQWCEGCGAPIQPGYKFCEVCGRPVAPASVSAPAPVIVHKPTYTERPLVDSGSDDVTTVLDEEDVDDFPTTLMSSELEVYIVRGSSGKRIDIELPAVLGKGSQATCLVAGNSAISRTHARISYTDEGFYLLEDLNTTNGTTVNGSKLERGGAAYLEDGMVFTLADEEFEFHKA